MDKKSEQIFKEIRQMELEASKDVKRTAVKINKQSREQSKYIALNYIGGYGCLVIYSKMGTA